MRFSAFLTKQAVNITNNLADIIRLSARVDAHKLEIILENIEKKFEKSLYKTPSNPTKEEIEIAKEYTQIFLNKFSNGIFNMDWNKFKQNSTQILRDYNKNKK